jgi:excisionase family DNA binding protein
MSTPLNSSADATIPWRERPIASIENTAVLLQCSRSHVYSLAREGHLAMVRLAGRTQVRTASIIALLDAAEPYTPGTGQTPSRGSALTRQRQRASTAA